MRKYFLASLLSILSFGPSLLAKTYPPFPEDAKKFLNSLPAKAVTMDLVVGLAVKNSDSFQQIKSQMPTVDVAELNSHIPLEFSTDTSFSYLLNRNEPDSPFGATRAENTQGALGFSKYFSSGTGVNFKINHGHTQRELSILGSQINDDFRSSYAELSLSQNLWRDSFGYATRKQLKSGKLQSEARKLEIEETMEDWLMAIVEIYYRAWSAQADVRAAESGLQRRDRLLDITRRKISGGTAERPDLLQVKSAHVGSKIRLQNARDNLDAIWRDLVVTLKFPPHWMNSDPLLVPVDLDNPTASALQLCQRNIKPAPTQSVTVRKSDLQRQSAQLSFEAAQNQASPQLQLNLVMGSNGVDTADAATSVDEAFSGSHPNYTAMLSLKVPWNNYQAKSQAIQAFSAKESTLAKYNDSLSRFQVNWSNYCEQLIHWQEKVNDLKQVVSDQKERAKLEESRFRLGRIPLMNLIQAGDDQTDAEINLSRAEVEFRMAAWRVRRLAGLLRSYLEQIGKRNA